MAKILIIIGIVLVAIGVLLLFFEKMPFLGKLPGDIIVKRNTVTYYVPITTSILVSIILTLIFYLMGKFK